jgi:serine protease Do
MTWQTRLLAGVLVLVAALPARAQAPMDDLNALHEKAMKAAVKAVAPSVVLIETTGGTETIAAGPGGQQIRKGVGPTTGLVVAADGYIISSAFNFANKPSAIFVAVPGHKERYVARQVATDQTRMVTLLKIDATGLPVPPAASKGSFRVGQSALALGRTLDPDVTHPPSVSKGILSALGRIWGKAVQTDCKVSPVNYGGPLVDIQGRVIGILVPASPRGQDETAGIEWYDSGIGFAMPLEDINAVLARLRQGQDLKRGLLGITPQNQDIYSARPVVATVAPDSTAANAGIKAGDEIVEIDGHKVDRQAQVMHLLGPKYEGDTVSLKIKRGTETIELKDLKMTGQLTSVANAFLGFLPMRDDPEAGVEVRYVFPKSPADTAGLKPGDRITKVTVGKQPPRSFSGRDQMQTILNQAAVGAELKLEVTRKGEAKPLTLTATLTAMGDAVPENLPQPATHKKALEPRKGPGAPAAPAPPKDPKKPETGLLKRTNAAQDHHFWVYVPENYDANIAHALVIWLHPAKGPGRDADDVVLVWKKLCEDNHIILVGPRAENDTGWIASEADFVVEAAKEVIGQYTIDRQRVLTHGLGVGGQMAYYLGFSARDLVRGVATVGAVLNAGLKDNVATQRLAFYIVAGGKDPAAKEITEGKARLAERKFPVTFRDVPELRHEYLDIKTLDELVRWIDALDRL